MQFCDRPLIFRKAKLQMASGIFRTGFSLGKMAFGIFRIGFAVSIAGKGNAVKQKTDCPNDNAKCITLGVDFRIVKFFLK